MSEDHSQDAAAAEALEVFKRRYSAGAVPTKEQLLQMLEDDFQRRMRERDELAKAQQPAAPAETTQEPEPAAETVQAAPRPPVQQTLNIVRGERIAPGQVVRLLWRDGNSLAIYPADFKIKTIHPNGRVALKLVK